MAYLMWLNDITAQEAFDIVLQQRWVAMPNREFQRQLELWYDLRYRIPVRGEEGHELYVAMTAGRGLQPAVAKMHGKDRPNLYVPLEGSQPRQSSKE